MSSVAISLVIIPWVVAFLLFLLFTYLHAQSRQAYFRAWQLGWAAYTLHYAIDAWTFFRAPWSNVYFSSLVYFLGSLTMVAMALCIFVSTRLMRERYRLRWYDIALAIVGVGLALWNLRVHVVRGVFRSEVLPQPHYRLEFGLAAILLYCSFHFYRYAYQKGSLAFRLLAISLAVWAMLMGSGEFQNPFLEKFGSLGHFLGPIPQMLLGIAMVMVLFENERNAVQENALAFSTLGVDPTRLLSAEDLVPSMQSILDRLVAPLPTGRAVIYISERWRAVLPSVHRGCSPECLLIIASSGAGAYVSDLAYRR